MNANHTPGPWGIERTDDTNWIGFMRPHDPNKIELIVCTTSRESLTDEALARNDANAQLISAAPDLLEALQRIVNSSSLTDVQLWADARDAVAKATGEGK